MDLYMLGLPLTICRQRFSCFELSDECTYRGVIVAAGRHVRSELLKPGRARGCPRRRNEQVVCNAIQMLTSVEL